MPGGTTRRKSDGSVVPFKTAVQAWAAAGRPVLEHVARSYGSYLTYEQLASEVQDAAGITTGVPFRHWIGRVLYEIASTTSEEEPILTSLVVHADQTIGGGYGEMLRERYSVTPADLEEHAAA